MTDTTPDPSPEPVTCPRNTGWCDGTICAENGVACPNADAEPGDDRLTEPPESMTFTVVCDGKVVTWTDCVRIHHHTHGADAPQLKALLPIEFDEAVGMPHDTALFLAGWIAAHGRLPDVVMTVTLHRRLVFTPGFAQ